MRALLPVALLGLAFGSIAPAQTPSQASPPAGKPEAPTPVSPVTVMPATAKPKVISTWPAAGATIAPGVLVLKVVFDQQMLPRDFAYSPGGAGETPECLKTPRLLNDNKTFVLLCRVLPGKSYSIAFNKVVSQTEGGGFANVASNRAEPGDLAFSTSSADPVTNLRDAISAAGLTSIDAPVEEAPAPGKPAA
ncbi:MAG: hypothetical protein J7521_06375 [Caulobacter sp.]|nr:hypothetical protein [Caulobacter sp.]